MQDILDRDDAWLEAVHDYIQWLFPLPEPSPFNPAAPVLTVADIAAFAADPSLRAALARMEKFYGLGRADAPRPWLTPGNHNFRRLTRILRALALLGLRAEAEALLARLEALCSAPEAAAAVGRVTRGYWRDAVAGPLNR